MAICSGLSIPSTQIPAGKFAATVAMCDILVVFPLSEIARMQTHLRESICTPTPRL
jgi:hypothetical protein